MAERVRPRQTESGFCRAVLDLARLYRWRTIHVRPAMARGGNWLTAVAGDGVGWPDLLCLRGPRVVVAELKVGRNQTTPEQDDWLAAWRLVPAAEVFVWRPTDWPEILRVMQPEG